MPHITLAVTPPVLQQVAAGHAYQRQLAIQGASPDLQPLIDTATRHHRVQLAICGVFALTVGDNGAIWGTHQNPGTQTDDFDNLYALLARRPGLPVTFTW